MRPSNPPWLLAVFAVLFTLIIAGGGMGGYYWWLFRGFPTQTKHQVCDEIDSKLCPTVPSDSHSCPTVPSDSHSCPSCPTVPSDSHSCPTRPIDSCQVVVCPPGTPDSECPAPVCPDDSCPEKICDDVPCVIENCVHVLTDSETGERYCAPSPPVDCRIECPIGAQVGNRVVEQTMCEGNLYLSSESKYCTRLAVPGTCGGDTSCTDGFAFVDSDIYCYDTCTDPCEGVELDSADPLGPFSCVSLTEHCKIECPVGWYDSGNADLAPRSVSLPMCSGVWYQASDGYKYTRIHTKPFCGGDSSCFVNTDWEVEDSVGHVVRYNTKWCDGGCAGTIIYGDSNPTQRPFECDQELPNVDCSQVCPTTDIVGFIPSDVLDAYYQGQIEDADCRQYNARPYLPYQDGYRYTYMAGLAECAGDDTCHFDSLGLHKVLFCERGVEHCQDTSWDGAVWFCDSSYYDVDCIQRCPTESELLAHGVEQSNFSLLVLENACIDHVYDDAGNTAKYLPLADSMQYTYVEALGQCHGDSSCEKDSLGMHEQQYCPPRHIYPYNQDQDDSCYAAELNGAQYQCVNAHFQDCAQVCPSEEELGYNIFENLFGSERSACLEFKNTDCSMYSFNEDGTPYEDVNGRPYYLASNGKLYSFVRQDGMCGGDESCHYKIGGGNSLPLTRAYSVSGGVLIEREHCSIESPFDSRGIYCTAPLLTYFPDPNDSSQLFHTAKFVCTSMEVDCRNGCPIGATIDYYDDEGNLDSVVVDAGDCFEKVYDEYGNWSSSNYAPLKADGAEGEYVQGPPYIWYVDPSGIEHTQTERFGRCGGDISCPFHPQEDSDFLCGDEKAELEIPVMDFEETDDNYFDADSEDPGPGNGNGSVVLDDSAAPLTFRQFDSSGRGSCFCPCPDKPGCLCPPEADCRMTKCFDSACPPENTTCNDLAETDPLYHCCENPTAGSCRPESCQPDNWNTKPKCCCDEKTNCPWCLVLPPPIDPCSTYPWLPFCQVDEQCDDGTPPPCDVDCKSPDLPPQWKLICRCWEKYWYGLGCYELKFRVKGINKYPFFKIILYWKPHCECQPMCANEPKCQPDNPGELCPPSDAQDALDEEVFVDTGPRAGEIVCCEYQPHVHPCRGSEFACSAWLDQSGYLTCDNPCSPYYPCKDCDEDPDQEGCDSCKGDTTCCEMENDRPNHQYHDKDAICYNHDNWGREPDLFACVYDEAVAYSGNCTRRRCDSVWQPTPTTNCTNSSYYDSWVNITDQTDCGQHMACNPANYCNNSQEDLVDDDYLCIMPYEPALCGGDHNPNGCMDGNSTAETYQSAWRQTNEPWNPANPTSKKVKAEQDRTTRCSAQNPDTDCDQRVCFRRNYTYANGCTEERVYYKTEWDGVQGGDKWYLVNFDVYYDYASTSTGRDYIDATDAGEYDDGSIAQFDKSYLALGGTSFTLDEYATGITSVQKDDYGYESNGWRLLYTMRYGYVSGGEEIVLRTTKIRTVGVYKNIGYDENGDMVSDSTETLYRTLDGNSTFDAWVNGTIGSTAYEVPATASAEGADAARRRYTPLLQARSTSEAITEFVSNASFATGDGLPRGQPDEDGYYYRYDINYSEYALYEGIDIQWMKNCVKGATQPPPFPEICTEKFKPYEECEECEKIDSKICDSRFPKEECEETILCDSVYDSKCYNKQDLGDGTFRCVEIPSIDCRVVGCNADSSCDLNRCGPQIGECVSDIVPATCNGRTDCDPIVRSACSTSGPNTACTDNVCFRLNFLNDCYSPRLEVKTTGEHRLFAFEVQAQPHNISIDLHTSQYVKQECAEKTFVYTTKQTHLAQKYCDDCASCLDEYKPEPAWTTIGYVNHRNGFHTVLEDIDITYWTVIWHGPPRNDGSFESPDAWGDVELRPVETTRFGDHVGSPDPANVVTSLARSKRMASEIYGSFASPTAPNFDQIGDAGDQFGGKPICRNGTTNDMVYQVLCAKHHHLKDHRWAGYPCWCCEGVQEQEYIPEMKDAFLKCSMAPCGDSFTNSRGETADEVIENPSRTLSCYDGTDSSSCTYHCSDYDCAVFQDLCEDPAAVNTGNYSTLNLLSCDAYEACLRGKALCEQVFCCPSFPNLEPCLPCDSTTSDGLQTCACNKRCEIDYGTCVGAQDAIDELARVVALEFDRIFNTGVATVDAAIDQMIQNKEAADSLMEALQIATQQTGHLTGLTLQNARESDLQVFFAVGQKFTRFGNSVKRKATVDLDDLHGDQLDKLQRVSRRFVDNQRTASLRSATTLSEVIEILGTNVFNAIDSQDELDRRCRKTLDMCVQTCNDSSIIAEPCALTFSCDHHLVASTRSMYALYLADTSGYHFTNALYKDVNSGNIHVIEQSDSALANAFGLTDTDPVGKEFTIHVGDGLGNLQSLEYSGFDRTGAVTHRTFDLVFFKGDRIFFHVQQITGAPQPYGTSYKSEYANSTLATEMSIFNEAIVMYKDGDTCDVYCYDQFGTRRSRTLSCNSFSEGHSGTAQLGSFCENYWQWEFASNNEFVSHVTARRVGCQLNHNGDCSTWNYITGSQVDMTCVDPCFVVHDSVPETPECVITGTCEETVYGCMNEDAINYMPNATIPADSAHYPERQCRLDTSYTCTIENRDPQNLGYVVAVLQCPTMTELEGCVWLEHINKNNGEPFGDFLPPWGQMEITVRYDDPNQFVTIVPGPGVNPDELIVFKDATQCDTLYACSSPVQSAFEDSNLITALDVGIAGISFKRPSQITLLQFRPPDYEGFVIAGDWNYTITPIFDAAEPARAASMRRQASQLARAETFIPACAFDCYSCDELFASECATSCTEEQIGQLKSNCLSSHG